MKNSIFRQLYHKWVIKLQSISSFRGGWMLTHQFLLDYKNNSLKHYPQIARCHLKGWSFNDWKILGMTKDIHKNYLSSRQYCSMHPFSGAESSWIDDKLTLKYILHGTELSHIMPEYYFQLEGNGRILKLMDAPKGANNDIDSIMAVLNGKGGIALKKIKASLGEGFYKIEKTQEGNYTVNNKAMNSEQLRTMLSGLSGYLVLELLTPYSQFAKYTNDSVGCLRLVLGRKQNGEIVDIYSFMRVGTKKSGSVENYNSGGVLLIVKDGKYEYGNILNDEQTGNRVITNHPDNNFPLKGEIPHWQQIKDISHQLADLMPQLNYMGIDFVLTEDNAIKVLEINSLTSLDAIQLDGSLLDGPGREFFKERLYK